MRFADMSLAEVAMLTLLGILASVVVLVSIDRYRLRHDHRHPH